jgi:ribosomal protein S18 acetylase RimI-like enzyme
MGRREIDELAVRPSGQRRGVGKLLLDAIAPDGTASWLVTSPAATAAVGFCRARGWDELTSTSTSAAGARVVVFASPLP